MDGGSSKTIASSAANGGMVIRSGSGVGAPRLPDRHRWPYSQAGWIA